MDRFSFFGDVYCFLKLRNNIILCGCSNKTIISYDMNTEEYKVEHIIKSHYDYGRVPIYALLMIDDNTFVSLSDDNTIKVWKY